MAENRIYGEVFLGPILRLAEKLRRKPRYKEPPQPSYETLGQINAPGHQKKTKYQREY